MTLDIEAIRARIHEAWEMPGGFDVLYGAAETVVHEDLHDLLAEVERLRAYVERLHAHRRAVIADHETYHASLEADNERLRGVLDALLDEIASERKSE